MGNQVGKVKAPPHVRKAQREKSYVPRSASQVIAALNSLDEVSVRFKLAPIVASKMLAKFKAHWKDAQQVECSLCRHSFMFFEVDNDGLSIVGPPAFCPLCGAKRAE